MIGVLDHEMDVERQICELANNRDDSRAEGNVIDEMSIHDVAMNPIGPGLLNPANFIGQSGKIGGEDGWRDKDPMHGVMESFEGSRHDTLELAQRDPSNDSITPLLRGLAAASFPLTGGSCVPRFYAFSGVETAGEH